MLTGRVLVDPRFLDTIQGVLAIPVVDGRPQETGSSEPVGLDSEGRYRLRLSSSGPKLVVVQSSWAPPVAASVEAVLGEEREVPDLQPAKAASVSGLVSLPDGRPAVDADLKLEPILEPEDVRIGAAVWRAGSVLAGRAVRTDFQGRYQAYGLVPGRYKLSLSGLDPTEIWLDSAAYASNHCVVTVPSENADLPLSYGQTQIDVFSAAGRLADARVTIRGPEGIETTESGIALGLKTGGAYEVIVSRKGFQSQRRPVRVRANVFGAVRFDLKEQAAQILVTPVGPTRPSHLRATIGRTRNGIFQERSGAWLRPRDGAFEIGGLEPGTWTLRLQESGLLAASCFPEEREVTLEAEALTRLEVAFRPAVRLRVFVQDALGGLGQAQVIVYDSQGNELARQNAAMGRSTPLKRLLAPGRYQVEARKGSQSSGRQSVTLEAEAIAELRLELGG